MCDRKMNGEGSVYKWFSDGRWVGALTLGYDGRGKRKRKTVSRQISGVSPALVVRHKPIIRNFSESRTAVCNDKGTGPNGPIPLLGLLLQSKITATGRISHRTRLVSP
jgi:hypothetical protein